MRSIAGHLLTQLLTAPPGLTLSVAEAELGRDARGLLTAMQILTAVPGPELLAFRFPSLNNCSEGAKPEYENLRINTLGSRFTFLLLEITLAIFLSKLFPALLFGGKKSNVLIVTAGMTLVQPASFPLLAAVEEAARNDALLAPSRCLSCTSPRFCSSPESCAGW